MTNHKDRPIYSSQIRAQRAETQRRQEREAEQARWVRVRREQARLRRQSVEDLRSEFYDPMVADQEHPVFSDETSHPVPWRDPQALSVGAVVGFVTMLVQGPLWGAAGAIVAAFLLIALSVGTQHLRDVAHANENRAPRLFLPPLAGGFVAVSCAVPCVAPGFGPLDLLMVFGGAFICFTAGTVGVAMVLLRRYSGFRERYLFRRGRMRLAREQHRLCVAEQQLARLPQELGLEQDLGIGAFSGSSIEDTSAESFEHQSGVWKLAGASRKNGERRDS